MNQEHQHILNTIVELEAIGLDALRARMGLLHERVRLEDMAGSLAEDFGCDVETALLAVHVAWTAHVDGDISTDTDPTAFRLMVDASARAVLTALRDRAEVIDDPLISAMVTQAVARARTGERVVPVRVAFESVGGLITKVTSACRDC